MAQAMIGLDIGGTRLRAARVGANGIIQARAECPSLPDPTEVLRRCLELIAQVRDDSVAGLGIGIPGQVIVETGEILSGGFVDLSGTGFVDAVRRATGLRVTIENDATMALLGEAAFGAARGRGSVVMLTIGTGIGGAVLERGRVLRGKGAAGELGHLVVNRMGRDCVCGNRGCVETESSGTAFARHLAEAGLPVGTRAQDLLARTDAVARAVIAAWAAPLRQAIDLMMAVCDPDCVVIGGGAGAGAFAALATVPQRQTWFHADLVLAELGDDAGVIGAAQAARALIDPPQTPAPQTTAPQTTAP